MDEKVTAALIAASVAAVGSILTLLDALSCEPILGRISNAADVTNANLSLRSIPTFQIRSDSFAVVRTGRAPPDCPQKISTIFRSRSAA
jgi:hypothetical protein